MGFWIASALITNKVQFNHHYCVACATLYPILLYHHHHEYHELSYHPLQMKEAKNKRHKWFRKRKKRSQTKALTNKQTNKYKIWLEYAAKTRIIVPMYVRPIVQFHKGHLTSFLFCYPLAKRDWNVCFTNNNNVITWTDNSVCAFFVSFYCLFSGFLVFFHNFENAKFFMQQTIWTWTTCANVRMKTCAHC